MAEKKEKSFRLLYSTLAFSFFSSNGCCLDRRTAWWWKSESSKKQQFPTSLLPHFGNWKVLFYLEYNLTNISWMWIIVYQKAFKIEKHWLQQAKLNIKVCAIFVQSECGKIRTRKTPYLDTFHAVSETASLRWIHFLLRYINFINQFKIWVKAILLEKKVLDFYYSCYMVKYPAAV